MSPSFAFCSSATLTVVVREIYRMMIQAPARDREAPEKWVPDTVMGMENVLCMWVEEGTNSRFKQASWEFKSNLDLSVGNTECGT